jgi:GH43 family beta-xylosidase
MRAFTNPVLGGGDRVDHGDPMVAKYLDTFYLYHSGETSGRKGISVYSSTNLVDWERRGIALEASGTGWPQTDVWAPEVVYDQGVFYMYVAAARTAAWGVPAGHRMRHLGLARSRSPLGPFEWDAEPLVKENWSIDGHPFRDDDGTLWMFYNRRINDAWFREGVGGTGNVVDRLIDHGRLAGEPTIVAYPSQRWEYSPDGRWGWNEGAWVVKRRGRYHQMYSGGHFEGGSYAVGLSSADDLRGPWVKLPDNPILRSGTRITGVGHHSLIFGPDTATAYAVYHGYLADPSAGRKVQLDRFHWRGDRPLIAGPSEGAQPRPPGPVLDPDVPHAKVESWVTGTEVCVHGLRFALDPPGVVHQLEIRRSGTGFSLRIGGVLRYAGPLSDERAVVGDTLLETATSHLDDEGWYRLPAGCVLEWPWHGAGECEIVAAARGRLTFTAAGDKWDVDSPEFALVRKRVSGVGRLTVTSRESGSVVTDLQLFAR